MDQRIARLERDVTGTKAVLARFESTLKSVNDDVKEMKDRLSEMPSTWRLIGLVVAIFGLAFVILRFTTK
jgi:septal ring factor EnvC (AmiA/AmiB activator)